MHLLVITTNPDRASFRSRIGMYLDLLRSKGIQTTVARLSNSVSERRALLMSARCSDAVLLQRTLLTAWDGYWLRRCGRIVIYDFDDAIMYSNRQPGRSPRRRLRSFGRAAALSSLVLAGNEYLADHARRYAANVRVLPTGLDLNPYRVTIPRAEDGRVRLVWIGSRSTLKYLREITPALEELGTRIPNLVLRIVCDEFLDLPSLKVEKHRWSRETEARDLMTSDIGLAPLPDDPFTRGKCGFKILQYRAAGLPVVASPVGVNAQYVQQDVTGFLARDLPQWVDRLRALVENPELRTTLGRYGQREVERFDVSVIGEQFCRLITECLGQEND